MFPGLNAANGNVQPGQQPRVEKPAPQWRGRWEEKGENQGRPPWGDTAGGKTAADRSGGRGEGQSGCRLFLC